MEINKTQKRHLIQALFSAIQNEESLIDAYSNVRDGSEKQPILQSKKWIRRWEKLLNHFEVKQKIVKTKPQNLVDLMSPKGLQKLKNAAEKG